MSTPSVKSYNSNRTTVASYEAPSASSGEPVESSTPPAPYRLHQLTRTELRKLTASQDGARALVAYIRFLLDARTWLCKAIFDLRLMCMANQYVQDPVFAAPGLSGLRKAVRKNRRLMERIVDDFVVGPPSLGVATQNMATLASDLHLEALRLWNSLGGRLCEALDVDRVLAVLEKPVLDPTSGPGLV